MIVIKPECADGAIRMLTKATHIGCFATFNFYMLDGKAWAIVGETVLRSDDSDETDLIRRACKNIALFYEIESKFTETTLTLSHS